MIIQKAIYDRLISCPQVPPEVGGILGMQNGIVNTILIDKGESSDNGGTYTPNIALLNRTIKAWNEISVCFAGVFHTHAEQWGCLSSDDIIYIKQILLSMPTGIDQLLFPLVFPGKNIKVYAAKRMYSEVYIYESDIQIIGEGGEHHEGIKSKRIMSNSNPKRKILRT